MQCTIVDVTELANEKKSRWSAGKSGRDRIFHWTGEPRNHEPVFFFCHRSVYRGFFFLVFLDAFSHLYKRVCPSVRRSVHPSHTSWNHAKVPFSTKTTISISENASYAVYPALLKIWWIDGVLKGKLAFCIFYAKNYKAHTHQRLIHVGALSFGLKRLVDKEKRQHSKDLM